MLSLKKRIELQCINLAGIPIIKNLLSLIYDWHKMQINECLKTLYFFIPFFNILQKERKIKVLKSSAGRKW